MLHYGIKGIEHDWFCSCSNYRKQVCNVNGVCSEIQAIEIGVPPGSCLGPLLFLLNINDLPFALKKPMLQCMLMIQPCVTPLIMWRI